MSTGIGERKTGELLINIQFGINRDLVNMTMSGTAQNDDADFLKQALLDATELCDIHEIRVVDLNIADLNFCYSACVKAFTEWMTCQLPRPSRIIVGIGKPFWQKTSMKALVGMSPNCTINDLTQVVVNPPMVVTTADIPESDCPETTTNAPVTLACAHVNRHSEEEHFFAPTGSGSIVTIVKCKDCGVELHRSSEYFD